MERERLLEKIKKASYFSILIDGATDSAMLENELLYIRYLSTEGPVNAYLSIEDVKNGNAAGVLDTIYAGSDEIRLLIVFSSYETSSLHLYCGRAVLSHE